MFAPGGGYFCIGKLRSKVQPHTLSYTIWQKRYPFRIPFIGKWYPYHIPTLRLSIPFKLFQTHCLSNLNKSQKQNVFSTFSQPLNASLRPVGPLPTKMTDFLTVSYTSTSKIHTLLYTWSLKKVPLSGGASRYKPLHGVPPHGCLTPPGTYRKTTVFIRISAHPKGRKR